MSDEIIVPGCTDFVINMQVCNVDPFSTQTINFYIGPQSSTEANLYSDIQGPSHGNFTNFGLNNTSLIGSIDNFDEDNGCQNLTFTIQTLPLNFSGAIEDNFVFYAWDNINDPNCNTTDPASFCDPGDPDCLPCQGPLCSQVCTDFTIDFGVQNAGLIAVSDESNNSISSIFTSTPWLAGDQPSDCSLFHPYLIRQDLVVDEDWCIVSGINNNRIPIILDPGAKIIIKDGVTARFTRIDFNSCSEIFWDAIVIESGGRLVMVDCNIEDGANALRMEEGGTISIDGCNFIDNNVGILLKGDTQKNEPFATFLRRNTFTGTGTLVTPFAGQNPIPNRLPHAGIQLQSVSFANISSIGLQFTNTFDNMFNGVVATNSSFLFGGAELSNMSRRNNANEEDISGYGIFAGNKGQQTNFVELRPFFTKTSFDNIPFGIFLRNVSTSIDGPLMNNVEIGIQYRDGAREIATITDCIISASRFGIQTSNNTPHIGSMTDNDILINSPFVNPTKAVASAGITCDENNTPGIGWDISDNKVTLVNGDAGVVYSGAFANISENEILKAGSSKIAFSLLDIDNSRASTVSCNNISANNTGTSTFSASVGVLVKDSPNMSISCNQVDNLEEGFSFDGPCDDTDFRANSMNNGAVGLALSAKAVLGQQSHKGNCFNDNIIAEALHNSNDPEFIQNSFFTVACNQEDGSLSCICPDLEDIFTSTFDPTDFFDQEPFGNTETCVDSDGQELCDDGKKPLRPTEPQDEISKRIASGETMYAADQPLLERMMQYNLYARLDQLGQEVQSSELSSFYSTNQQSSLGRIHDAINLTTVYKDQTELRENVSAILDDIESLQRAYFENQISEETYLIQSANLDQALQNWRETIRNNDLVYQQDVIHELDAKRILLNQLTPTNLYDANMKFIMSKVLAARHPNFVVFEAEEYEGIYELAIQCSSAAGQAVYWARTLYNNNNTWTDFARLSDCQSITQRSTDAEPVDLNSGLVYPNPSTGTFTFAWNDNDTAQLQIVDISGNTILESVIQSGENKINLQSHAKGVYFYTISKGNDIQKRGKLVLVE